MPSAYRSLWLAVATADITRGVPDNSYWSWSNIFVCIVQSVRDLKCCNNHMCLEIETSERGFSCLSQTFCIDFVVVFLTGWYGEWLIVLLLSHFLVSFQKRYRSPSKLGIIVKFRLASYCTICCTNALVLTFTVALNYTSFHWIPIFGGKKTSGVKRCIYGDRWLRTCTVIDTIATLLAMVFYDSIL
jgi:hypothetical protein